jgi:hypothetical protein
MALVDPSPLSGAVPRLRALELKYRARGKELEVMSRTDTRSGEIARLAQAGVYYMVADELSALLEGITREENDTRHDRQSASGPTGSSR